MLFNIEKCHVIHFGPNNMHTTYEIDGQLLSVAHEERDLGIMVSSDLKVSNQCAKAVATANRVLGMISRTISDKSKGTVLQLYKSLVRPHLEYCIQAWRPHYQKDIDLLERVQRRATRMITGFKGISYEERLRLLKITTLETRRLRGDLIETFKIMKGYEGIDASNFFELSNTVTRGHNLKICKGRFNRDIGRYSFRNRVVDEWNSLPQDIIDAPSINAFKNRLDRHFVHVKGFE